MTGIRVSDSPQQRLRVGFVLATNFTLSAFSLFVDHLRLAADKDDRSRQIHCSWQILSSAPHPIRSSCGISISRDAPLDDPRTFDYIVVVGGLLQSYEPIDQTTVKWLQRAAAAGVTLIGMCTGTFILCRAGLMDQRPVCVSWYHRQDFVDAFPDHDVVSDQMFLDDGDRITCSGGGAAADVALHVIERNLGRSAGLKASHILLMGRDLTSSAQFRLQPQPPTLDPLIRKADRRVQRAILIMEQNMSCPVPIERIAASLTISSRQLERLFQNALGRKPQDFYRSLRLQYARALLETGQVSVTNVAIEAGFSDCAHFSRHFKLAYGISPRIYHRSAIKNLNAHPAIAASHAGVRIFPEL
jgi:transcriptional regulator GlxA family with amidase domain